MNESGDFSQPVHKIDLDSRETESQEDNAVIRDACIHFKDWLKHRPIPECYSTDSLLRHPLEPPIMVVGPQHQDNIAAFYGAVWRASMNSENMPRTTVVHSLENEYAQQAHDTLDGLAPSDRAHHDAVVASMKEVLPDSQAAAFLPFGLDNIYHGRASYLELHQATLLHELRKPLQSRGIVVAVTRRAETWRETAQYLGYTILDDMSSEKDEALSVVTLEKQDHMPIDDIRQVLAAFDFPAKQHLNVLEMSLDLWLDPDPDSVEVNASMKQRALKSMRGSREYLTTRLARIANEALPLLRDHPDLVLRQLYDVVQGNYDLFMTIPLTLDKIDQDMETTQVLPFDAIDSRFTRIQAAMEVIERVTTESATLATKLASHPAYVAYRATTNEADRRA